MKIRLVALASAGLVAGVALTIGSTGFATAAPLPAQPPNSLVTSFDAAATDQDIVKSGLSQDPEMKRQVVSYPTKAAAGTVIIDTAQTHLYYVLGDNKAIRYGIGVGRDGFTWSGEQSVTRKAEWPDWSPPEEMIARQPYLPRWMAGGESNPLGARALYLGNTVYRIHGTNMPETIGQKVSSGCIRMVNADVIDLYDRVEVGAKIIVLPNNSYTATIARSVVPTRIVAAGIDGHRPSNIY
jgi:lipoprotein-anchoring transpeptidase ErfK/SrfK